GKTRSQRRAETYHFVSSYSTRHSRLLRLSSLKVGLLARSSPRSLETKRKSACLRLTHSGFRRRPIPASLDALRGRRLGKWSCRPARTANAGNRKFQFAWIRSSAGFGLNSFGESRLPAQCR